jgi:hypothetical protein
VAGIRSLGGQNEAVNDRINVRAGNAVGKQPVLTTDNDALDVPLGNVVVDRQASIVNVAADSWPLIARIFVGRSQQPKRKARSIAAFSEPQALNI